MTFDVRADFVRSVRNGWQRVWELFCVCRQCNTSTVFVAHQGGPDPGSISRDPRITPTTYEGPVTDFLRVEGFVTIKDLATTAPPEHCPPEVTAAFHEGATCMTVECWNAACTMFRLCVDLATRPMIEKIDDETLNTKTRRDLGLRLPWLFDHGHLSEDLRDLSTCIKEDGNDAAHAGTIGKAEAEDLRDFTEALLKRIYTEPKRVEAAKERRLMRGGSAANKPKGSDR